MAGQISGVASTLALINALRVKRVKLWALADVGTQQVSLVWGSSQGPSDAITAIGNATFPAHVDARPPPQSYAALWQMHDSSSVVGAEGNLVFAVIVSSSTVLDLECEMVLEGDAAGAVGSINDPAFLTATSTVGGLFYTHLDSLSSNGLAAGSRLAAPNYFTPLLISSRTP